MFIIVYISQLCNDVMHFSLIFVDMWLTGDEMNYQKYSRLPTSEPAPEFAALDGPSYYSYEIERKKYGSAFSYSGVSGSAEHAQSVGKMPCIHQSNIQVQFCQ